MVADRVPGQQVQRGEVPGEAVLHLGAHARRGRQRAALRSPGAAAHLPHERDRADAVVVQRGEAQRLRHALVQVPVLARLEQPDERRLVREPADAILQRVGVREPEHILHLQRVRVLAGQGQPPRQPPVARGLQRDLRAGTQAHGAAARLVRGPDRELRGGAAQRGEVAAAVLHDPLRQPGVRGIAVRHGLDGEAGRGERRHRELPGGRARVAEPVAEGLAHLGDLVFETGDGGRGIPRAGQRHLVPGAVPVGAPLQRAARRSARHHRVLDLRGQPHAGTGRDRRVPRQHAELGARARAEPAGGRGHVHEAAPRGQRSGDERDEQRHGNARGRRAQRAAEAAMVRQRGRTNRLHIRHRAVHDRVHEVRGVAGAALAPRTQHLQRRHELLPQRGRLRLRAACRLLEIPHRGPARPPRPRDEREGRRDRRDEGGRHQREERARRVRRGRQHAREDHERGEAGQGDAQAGQGRRAQAAARLVPAEPAGRVAESSCGVVHGCGCLRPDRVRQCVIA